tara:strand:+ start:461 stop:829 length:369 start_codon:yes stop_codon:yes gene_type:complete
MIKSKDNDSITTINLNNLYEPNTITISSSPSDCEYTTDTGSEYTFNISDTVPGTVGTISTPTFTTKIDLGTKLNFLDDVERMCKEYPALEKVWRNFKNVYDMCEQDYKGKVKAGEITNDTSI